MARAETVAVLRSCLSEQHAKLEAAKRDYVKLASHPDWPWIGFILSGATRGGSWRWEKRVKPIYDTELSWAALETAAPVNRRTAFEKVGRFWRRTADWLEKAYTRLTLEGGPDQLREKLKAMSASEVLTYLKSFDEVGDKYARNIMMDVYHPDFRTNFFAIDVRIEKLLPLLGYTGSHVYEDREAFLVALANECGVEAWELDRTLYGAADHLVERLARVQAA